ncbi:plasmid mobilization protein [Blautia sp. MB18-30]|uniref:plasmid mobilization protein n=1 Tax=Blautia sp. MB18-30 TaxID=2949744 RepID=UPI002ED35682
MNIRSQYDFTKRKEKPMSIKTFTLRLTEEQIDFVGEKAKEMGVSKNDYIRRLIDGDIRADKEDRILQEIIEIKNMLEKSMK